MSVALRGGWWPTGMAVIAALRLAAIRWGGMVPAFELSTTQEYQARRTREPESR